MKILVNVKLIGQIIVELSKLVINAIHYALIKIVFKFVNASVKWQDKILHRLQMRAQKINWKLEVERKIPVNDFFPLMRLLLYSKWGTFISSIVSLQIKICKKLHLIKDRG